MLKDAIDGKGAFDHLKWIDYLSNYKLLIGEKGHIKPLLLDFDVTLIKDVKVIASNSMPKIESKVKVNYYGYGGNDTKDHLEKISALKPNK